VLARLAGRVAGGRGRRMIVQTSWPTQPLAEALRRGDPMGFLAVELETRARFGYPPAGEVVVVEVRGSTVGDADHAIREAAGGRATVLGPAQSGTAYRWLVQGRDLATFKGQLRPVVQRWRDGGATVRIDVDPIDL
ncbi:MAG: hypothetical protein ACRDVM_09470, partial [Acidimicrobiia bacterium]